MPTGCGELVQQSSGLFNPTIQPQAILKIQIAQRQISEYQQGVCPLDWAMALALIGVYVIAEPQAILKLHLSTSLEAY
jgi:hypothetical protein